MKIIDLNERDMNMPAMLDGDREQADEKPPIAQDFTENPFSASEPVHIPDEHEREAVWERMRKQFKVLHEEVKKGGELSGDKVKLVEDGSTMAANVLSACMGLLFSLMGEEYTVLAPTKDLSYKMILPATRIWARHSKIAGEISPDYVDASACLAAVAEYTRTVVSGMRQIKWMHENGYVYVGTQPGSPDNYPPAEPAVPPAAPGYQYNERPYPGYEYVTPEPGAAYAPQNGTGGAPVGSIDTGGLATNGSKPRGGLGTTSTILNEGITAEQRRQHEKLLELTRRDLQARQRRAGLL